MEIATETLTKQVVIIELSIPEYDLFVEGMNCVDMRDLRMATSDADVAEFEKLLGVMLDFEP